MELNRAYALSTASMNESTLQQDVFVASTETLEEIDSPAQVVQVEVELARSLEQAQVLDSLETAIRTSIRLR